MQLLSLLSILSCRFLSPPSCTHALQCIFQFYLVDSPGEDPCENEEEIIFQFYLVDSFSIESAGGRGVRGFQFYLVDSEGISKASIGLAAVAFQFYLVDSRYKGRERQYSFSLSILSCRFG